MLITQKRLQQDSTWSGAADSALADAQLILLFGAARALGDPKTFDALRRAHPTALIVGCTTAGDICGTTVSDGGAVATVVQFETAWVRAAALPVSTAEDSRETGTRLARMLPVDDLTHVLVLAEGIHINGSELAEGLRAALPHHVAVTGGLAADGDRFEETLVCFDAPGRTHLVAVVGLYGADLRAGYGSLGGWDSFGPERLVTRARGSVLYELDGTSALALYRQYLGSEAAALPASGLRFPLSLRTGDEGARLVRTIVGIDQSEGSLRFAGDIPEGSYVQLMRANTDRLIDGAAGAAGACRPLEPGSAELALLISCVGRRLVLQQRVEEEVEVVRETLGAGTALCGFYSYGEIAPFASSVRCELHNQTMTITTLSER